MQLLKPMDSSRMDSRHKHFTLSVAFHSGSKNLHQELTTTHLQLFAAICICFPLHRGSLVVFNRNSKGKHLWNVFEGNLWTVKEEKNSLSSVTSSRRLQSASTWHNQPVFSWFKWPNEKPGNSYWGFNSSSFFTETEDFFPSPYTKRLKKIRSFLKKLMSSYLSRKSLTSVIFLHGNHYMILINVAYYLPCSTTKYFLFIFHIINYC